MAADRTGIRKKWIAFCLAFPGAYEDYPFDDNWTAMRHGANRRTFAFLYEREGHLWMNLKCEPFEADFLRRAYPSVTPAYHMNKTHWNTVALDGSVPDGAVEKMIADSYHLIRPKITKRTR